MSKELQLLRKGYEKRDADIITDYFWVRNELGNLHRRAETAEKEAQVTEAFLSVADRVLEQQDLPAIHIPYLNDDPKFLDVPYHPKHPYYKGMYFPQQREMLRFASTTQTFLPGEIKYDPDTITDQNLAVLRGQFADHLVENPPVRNIFSSEMSQKGLQFVGQNQNMITTFDRVPQTSRLTPFEVISILRTMSLYRHQNSLYNIAGYDDVLEAILEYEAKYAEGLYDVPAKFSQRFASLHTNLTDALGSILHSREKLAEFDTSDPDGQTQEVHFIPSKGSIVARPVSTEKRSLWKRPAYGEERPLTPLSYTNYAHQTFVLLEKHLPQNVRTRIKF